jgi:hypothetical protein
VAVFDNVDQKEEKLLLRKKEVCSICLIRFSEEAIKKNQKVKIIKSSLEFVIAQSENSTDWMDLAETEYYHF